MKYEIELSNEYGSGSDLVYQVTAEDGITLVDYDTTSNKAFCTSCSGPLSAQLSTCVHAKAVKRFADKIYKLK